MLKLFCKRNGTISVFLSLILLPTLLVGGLTVDASRIFMSKVVISDAGEMALNAGLAQYNDILHDEYGLLVMDQSPAEMEQALKAYFDGSLNGAGLLDAGDYKKILDLMEEKFSALNVAGSEIYRTEVEKQQILEYMKYRAPVCLTELVVQKFQELKDVKKMTAAMEAEMDFSEAMDDCQDAFRKAKEKLDVLNQTVNNFPSSERIQEEFSNTEKEYKEIVSKNLLMYAAIQQYDQRSSDTDLKRMAEGFITAAKNVDLSLPDNSRVYNQYLNSLNCKNTVEYLGGVEKLLENYDQEQDQKQNQNQNQETEEIQDGGENEGAANESASGAAQPQPSTDPVREDLEELVREYQEQENRISGYPGLLYSAAEDCVNRHSGTLKEYRDLAEAAEQAAKAANEELKEVKKALDEAKKKFNAWDSAASELKETGKSGGMDEEVEKYRTFFEKDDGKSDLEALENLMTDVKEDQNYFEEWKKILEKEKFHGQAIVKVSTEDQMNQYLQKAKQAVSEIDAQYSSLESVRGSYASEYEHGEITNTYLKKSINDHPFYVKLQQYCKETNEEGGQEEKRKANENLEKSKEAGKEANQEDAYPTFNWSSAGVSLPSSQTGMNASAVSDQLTGLDGGGNISSNRRDVLSKFKRSIQEANSFLDGVDQIVTNGIENLYIAEYAMQMFSYYTVNKENGSDRPDGEVIGISGYSLKEHKAYRAECEYILWGKERSQENVRDTVMMIFGIRLLFNSFYAFTDAGINLQAEAMAWAIVGTAPYLVPLVKALIKLAYAGAETALDLSKLKQGYGVTIFKKTDSWALGGGDNTKGVTFDYSEYLRIFLNVSMLAGNEVGILGRIADCIQVNTAEIDLMHGYTMIAIEAKVRTRTTFMRKISDWGEDTYTISYQSILGY